MPVLKPRNRLVYFRVSEEEFERFTKLCEVQGARSLSDLARNAVNRMAEGCDDGRSRAEAALDERITALDQLTRSLNDRLDALAALLKEREA